MKKTKMRKSKRASLEAHGWRVGSPRQLLGLSAQEATFIDIKLALARHLRTQRQKRGWSQAEVARRIRSSQSRVAKMEAGDALVSIDLLVRTLLAIGATRRDVARMIGSRAA
jgi:ribosome-binding protein aMBF1 (putative translation factor)